MEKSRKGNEGSIKKKISERLQSIDPPVKRIAVEPPDQIPGVYLLRLELVCYITRVNDYGREETAFLTSDGKTYYNNMKLDDVEKHLSQHPDFLRTSQLHIVNLAKIRGVTPRKALDLCFEGIEKPVVNIVTGAYLKEFEKRTAMKLGVELS